MHNFDMKMYEINIKIDNPAVDVAVYDMINAIDFCRLSDIKLLKVIYGYGSHGKGGEIKKECLNTLRRLVRNKIIYDYIPCEKFSQSHKYYDNIVKYYPPVAIDNELQNNFGVVLIIVSKL